MPTYLCGMLNRPLSYLVDAGDYGKRTSVDSTVDTVPPVRAIASDQSYPAPLSANNSYNGSDLEHN